MKLRQTAALACMFCMPIEPPDDFEEKVVEKITLKQKLANKYAPDPILFTNMAARQGYLAGFEKARELSAELAELGFHHDRFLKDLITDIRNLGEEMVDE